MFQLISHNTTILDDTVVWNPSNVCNGTKALVKWEIGMVMCEFTVVRKHPNVLNVTKALELPEIRIGSCKYTVVTSQ